MTNNEYKTKILMTEFVTHNVKRFILEKPEGYKFTPGQATEVSIANENCPENLKGEKRPFTFTSLNNDKILEFTIKGYPEHDGVTKEMHNLVPGDKLIIGQPWGTINYSGPGVFIAGGAGITPFIAILRDLRLKDELEGNKLIFSNKKQKDIILEKEFKDMFNENYKNLTLTLTDEKKEEYKQEKINKEFLKDNIKDFNQKFYLCGPPTFVKDIKSALKDLGANTEEVVFEK